MSYRLMKAISSPLGSEVNVAVALGDRPGSGGTVDAGKLGATLRTAEGVGDAVAAGRAV